MQAELRSALAGYLLGLADDELILAHRDSEWTGHAPIIEEDIAFSNIALDEMGHAQIWYRLHAELVDEDPDSYPDWLVFQREAPFFRNVRLVELPNGDWARTILRQYLFDALETERLPGLEGSDFAPLAQAATKVAAEELYHLRHSEAWLRRLGRGTEESHRRMQRALDDLWGPAQQLSQAGEKEERLIDAKLVPAAASVRDRWLERVLPALEEAGLAPPDEEGRLRTRREHSEDLLSILSELQQVARALPGADW